MLFGGSGPKLGAGTKADARAEAGAGDEGRREAEAGVRTGAGVTQVSPEAG